MGLKKPPLHKKRTILDNSNGRIYNTSKELADVIGVNRQWIINRLNGTTKNLTTYSYI